MTKEQIENSKINCGGDTDLAKRVINKLEELGFINIGELYNVKELILTGFINYTFFEDKEDFDDHYSKEITPQDVLDVSEQYQDSCVITQKQSDTEITSKPKHYTNSAGLDVFGVADIFEIKDPRHFSALKYVLRCGKKDEALGEIKKAIHCLELYREHLKKELCVVAE